MKTSALLILSLVALLTAGCSDKSQPENTPPAPSPSVSDRANTALQDTKEVIGDAREALDAKLTEWKLTPADIKADLEKTGRVIRKRTLAAGERVGGALDNTRLVTVINGKFIADRDLSALKINVDANEGIVTLTGEVASLDLAGRAIALALDTEGVTQVIGQLKVMSDDTSDTPADDSPTMM